MMIIKSLKLELNYLKENKTNLILLFVLPSTLTYLFALVTQVKIQWLQGGITYFDFYAPIIIPTILLFITTQVVVLRIVGERAPYGTLDRDLLAISRTGMYLGKFFTYFFVVLLQSFIIWIIVDPLFQVRMLGHSWLAFLFIFSIGTFGIALGLLFSVITKTKELAVQLVPFTILVFFVLNGSIIKPEVMPFAIKFIAANLPLTLVTDALNRVLVYGHGFQPLLNNVFKLVLWIVGTVLLGLIVFHFENRESKSLKKVAAYLISLLILVGVVFSSFALLKPSWGRMTIDDFHINEVVGELGTYPFIADGTSFLSFVTKHIQVDVKQVKEYSWNIQGQQLIGAAVVLEANSKESLKSIKFDGQSLSSKVINGEEVFYSVRDVKGRDVAIYIWDEDRFVFIVAGLPELIDMVVGKAVSSYPVQPTKNVILPSETQLKNIFSSLG